MTWWASIFALAYGTQCLRRRRLNISRCTHTRIRSGSFVWDRWCMPLSSSLESQYSSSPSINRVIIRERRRNHASGRQYMKYALNSLAATAIVRLLLDLWRMYLGNIYALDRPTPPDPRLPCRSFISAYRRERCSSESKIVSSTRRFECNAILRFNYDSLHILSKYCATIIIISSTTW